jgi:DNA-binding response OmpR family regulator
MSKRILIIDDEEHIRRMMRLTLEAAGHEVGEAADGLQGLAAFGNGAAWDAVLLDQKMPGLDGLETLRRLKERDPSARVIMVTAFASIELAVDAMKLGALDFVRKPMTPEVVRNAVEAATAKPRRGPIAETAAPPAGEEVLPSARPSITMVTMNGFTIVRAPEAAGAASERRFIVRNPNGWEQEVTVEIAPEAIERVERMTRRHFPCESSFWTAQAERALSAFLWDEGRIPPGRTLTLRDVDREEILAAARWDLK